MRKLPLRAAAFTALGLAASPALAAGPIEEHTCPNGLTVLVVEDHALPLVTIEIAAKNGSMTESPEYNGLSHLYEHMFFKANKAMPSQEAYLARTRELGIIFNGTTSTERVNYFFTTTSDHFADSMVFMHDAIVSPLFNEKELERERTVVTGEMDRAEASPFFPFSRTIDAQVWWKYPSTKDPLGNRKTVLSATSEKMRTIQARYYVPNNSALVITGDVKAKDVFARTDTLFADWAKGQDPFKKFPVAQHPAIKKSVVLTVEEPVQSFTGQVVWQGPSTVAGKGLELTYAADLLAVAMNEPSSKFQKTLVDSGACVAAGFSWYTQKHTGPITLSFEAAPDRADACVKAALAELPRIAEPAYLTDEELANAAHSIEIDRVRERERVSGYAHLLTFWWTTASLDYYRGYIDNVKKVTRPEIGKYMHDYVLGKPYVFGALVSPDMAKKGMTQEHFEALAGLPHTALAKAAPTPIAAPKGKH
jgi:zinc protease